MIHVFIFSLLSVSNVKTYDNSLGLSDNNFYQLTLEEKDNYLGIQDSIDYLEYENLAKNLVNNNNSNRNRNLYSYVPILYKDYRNINGRNYVSVVKDQGQCGSCVSFSVTSLMETMYILQDSFINLSERDLFFCKGNRDCESGWTLESATRVLKNQGAILEKCCKYIEGFNCCINSDCGNSEIFKLKNYYYLNSVDQFKDWLINHGPIITRLNIYLDFYSYQEGIYQKNSNNYRGAHSVMIVGFDEDEQYWIVQNSWGVNWGENGYFRIKYGESGILPYAYGYDVGNVTKYSISNSACKNKASYLILGTGAFYLLTN